MDDFDFVPGRDFIPEYSTSTAAPKLPDYELPQEEEIKQAPQKQQKPARQISPRLNALIIMSTSILVLTVIFGMLSSVIYLNKVIVENKQEIQTLNTEIRQAEAENTRLSATLGAMMSADKIQEYAESTLGMQKVERYQIHYFEDRDGDKVVVADGRIS